MDLPADEAWVLDVQRKLYQCEWRVKTPHLLEWAPVGGQQ